MDGERPRALIAAPAAIIRELGSALADGVDTVGAETLLEAVERLNESSFEAIIICYAFDELRPFRLLHHLRDGAQRPHVPTVLVRALPVPLGKTQEDEIRVTYGMLGVDQFFNLHAQATRIGRPRAVQEFHNTIFALLRLEAL